ncbi:MAG: type VI secretion system tube protein Hcp [Planctomycetes bacterium]|nr:type VI secretion system tube protein Hcp [Planctomycetota bacterium]
MAVDIFLKFADGSKAKGESTDKKHTGEIELQGFSIGLDNPASIGSATTGAGSGKVNFSPLTCTKKVDKSSAVLFQMCAAGDHFATATLTVRKAGKDALEYIVYTFTEVYISGLNQYVTEAKGETAEESLSLSFASVHMKYTPQKPDGTGDSPVEGGWDITQNQPK